MENGEGLGPWVNYKGFQALHLCHQIHVSKISDINGIIARIGICKIITSTIPSQQISVKNRINKWANTWLDIVVCLLLTEYVFMRIYVSYKNKSWSQVQYMYSRLAQLGQIIQDQYEHNTCHTWHYNKYFGL